MDLAAKRPGVGVTLLRCVGFNLWLGHTKDSRTMGQLM